MPRETIHGSELPFGGEYPAVAVVQVGWSREAEHVDIVTRCVHRADEGPLVGRGEAQLLNAAAPLADAERLTADTSEDVLQAANLPPHATARPVDEGFYVNLDRSAINDLIRVLRRARDQAFGKDE